MQFQPKCERVEESVRYGNVELLSLHYDVTAVDRLTLQLRSSIEGDIQLVFDSPLGVRVLDEGQICEFWNSYSTPNGWLWRVLDGGWVALESQRSVFWATQDPARVVEYLVVDDQCVSVMTTAPPRFQRIANGDRPVA
jgi:hypothetical protein